MVHELPRLGCDTPRVIGALALKKKLKNGHIGCQRGRDPCLQIFILHASSNRLTIRHFKTFMDIESVFTERTPVHIN